MGSLFWPGCLAESSLESNMRFEGEVAFVPVSYAGGTRLRAIAALFPVLARLTCPESPMTLRSPSTSQLFRHVVGRVLGR